MASRSGAAEGETSWGRGAAGVMVIVREPSLCEDVEGAPDIFESDDKEDWRLDLGWGCLAIISSRG